MWTVPPTAPALMMRPGPTFTQTWALQCLPGGPLVWGSIWSPKEQENQSSLNPGDQAGRFLSSLPFLLAHAT